MPETLSLALKLNRPQDLYHGRTRHPNEVPFVTDSQAGRINLQFYPDETPKNGWIGSLKRLIRRSYVSCFRDNAKEGMKLADLFSHCITFGGPGSGKTFSFIQPLRVE